MHRRLTIPNIVALARIAMAGLAALLAVGGGADAAAVAILIAAAWLDVFDGWYARAFSQCTALGKHLDPLADKVLMGVVYVWVGFDAGSRWVWALVALAGVREVGITLLRWHSLSRYGRFIPASRLGRAKMLAQSVAGLTILSVTHFLGRPVRADLVAGAIVLTLSISYVAGVAYLREWRRAVGSAVTTHGAAANKGVCRRPEADPLCATQHHG